jgi:hypothetical protein
MLRGLWRSSMQIMLDLFLIFFGLHVVHFTKSNENMVKLLLLEYADLRSTIQTPKVFRSWQRRCIIYQNATKIQVRLPTTGLVLAWSGHYFYHRWSGCAEIIPTRNGLWALQIVPSHLLDSTPLFWHNNWRKSQSILFQNFVLQTIALSVAVGNPRAVDHSTIHPSRSTKSVGDRNIDPPCISRCVIPNIFVFGYCQSC